MRCYTPGLERGVWGLACARRAHLPSAQDLVDPDFCPLPMAAKPSSLLRRRRIQVRGVVQGVGFRPYVYNLAQNLGLVGYALNSSAGVTIELQGDDAEIERFLHTLRSSPPP